MKRNDFLKKAIAGTVALFSFGWAALARKSEDKKSEKPPLTPGNLNKFFAKYERNRADQPLNESIADAKTFVDKYFSYISPEQKTRIGQIKKEEWRQIQSILSDMKQRKGTVDFKFINKEGMPDIVANCQIEIRLQKIGFKDIEIKKFVIP